MGDMIERMASVFYGHRYVGNREARDRDPIEAALQLQTVRAALRAVTASDISYAMYAALVDVMNEPPNDESSEARVRRALAAAMQKASEE